MRARAGNDAEERESRMKSAACWWALLMLGAGLAASAADPYQASWKIGRAAFEAQPRASGTKELNVKLSLRNEGRPGHATVRILGRWQRTQTSNGTSNGDAPASVPATRWGASASNAPKALPWGEAPDVSPSAPRAGSTEGLRTLGNYAQEVALKQTVILDIPLRALGAPPNAGALELVVFTGARETDRQAVRLP